MEQINNSTIRLDIGGSTKEIVYKATIDYNCSLGQAVHKIIKEWAENRISQSLETETEPSYLDDLATKLETIDSLASEVITKLKRASL